jgi:Gas vesicle synthesis protein GvpL/GvpF
LTHLYVYAAVAGQPKPRAVKALPAVPDGAPPRILSLDDRVSLIVSDVSSTTYNTEQLTKQLADLDWVSRCGAAHHAVADKLAESHAVLPFRLFSVFSSEAKALAALRKTKTRIAKALDRVKGRQEWVLRITRPDPARIGMGDVRKTGARKTPKGRVGVAAAASTPSGTTFLRAKADARREAAERATRVKADAAAVFDKLRTMADDATARPVEPANALLLDAAFLVPTLDTEAFHQALTDAAAGLLRDGCAVTLTGPWPPYSFASLE